MTPERTDLSEQEVQRHWNEHMGPATGKDAYYSWHLLPAGDKFRALNFARAIVTAARQSDEAGRMRGFTERDAFRFWSRVLPVSSGCWEWTGHRNTQGYGQFGFRKNGNIGAHRVAYTLCVADIPTGLFVRHACDNPPCVNPAHLSVGTAADNARDMMERNRSPSRAGNQNGRARLTPEQVAEIRLLCEGGLGYKRLARIFNVGRVTVRDIIHGKTWRLEQ